VTHDEIVVASFVTAIVLSLFMACSVLALAALAHRIVTGVR
jgi:hypothetical protein